MGKKIRCVVDGSSWVKAKPYPLDKEVMISFFEDENMGNIWLTPSDARKLRKQIKKALEVIESGEEEVEEKDKRFPDWFQPDAIVEITDNNNEHHFDIGEKVRVGAELGDEGSSLRCDYLDGHDYWFVLPTDCKPA